ncbi:MAG: DnaB-like helicase C-terminal domain-containing protein [Nitrospirota bacterium]
MAIKSLPEIPRDIDAEKSFLCICLNSGMFYDVSPDIFYDYQNQDIIKACQKIIAAGMPITAVNVLRELKNNGKKFDYKTIPYLADLTRFEPILFDVTRKEAFNKLAIRYIQKIQDAASLRKLTEVISEIFMIAKEPGTTSDDILAKIQKAKAETEAVAPTKSTLVSLEDVLKRTLWDLKEVMDDPEKHRGITTGLRVLDNATGGGLYPGEMWIICGRPGSGKSAMAWGIATSVARTGKTVLGVSLEMGLSELGRRFLSAKTSYPTNQFRTGKGLEDKLVNILDTADSMKSLPLFLEEKVRINEVGLRQDIEKIKPNVVILDYLQLMSATGKFYNREGEIASLSRFMKLAALEYGLTFIVLSQLNRDLKGRASKVPQLTDLRESGSLEQDSDIVIGLLREEGIDSGEAALYILKNRNNRIGKFSAYFDGPSMTFSDLMYGDVG